MSYKNSPGLVTNEKLNEFFAVGEDKRIEILQGLGLSHQQKHDWTTIWAALGLSAVQRHKLWKELQAPLIGVAEVAGIIERDPKTVSGWCYQGEYRVGFPVPFNFGPRTKRWIALEVQAYQRPALYGKLARNIARPSPSSRKVLQRPVRNAPLPTTLEPVSLS